jgi:hypothetical protein
MVRTKGQEAEASPRRWAEWNLHQSLEITIENGLKLFL